MIPTEDLVSQDESLVPPHPSGFIKSQLPILLLNIFTLSCVIFLAGLGLSL